MEQNMPIFQIYLYFKVYARKYFTLILVLCCRETGHFSEFTMKCAACMFKSPI